jgi:stearoyl-CoA desaturase (delta-9 desaturase)
VVAAVKKSQWRQLWGSVLAWFDSSAVESPANVPARRIDWLRTVPFIGMHLACLGVVWVGWSPVAVATAIALYLVRMFAITGFYHRYFSHRSFKTSRVTQFIFALVGAASVQRGPIWWAAHHRHHHATTEQEDDPHSPVHHGLWFSHTGWFLTREHFPVQEQRVRDLQRFPELRFLDRFDIVVPAILAVGLFLMGKALEAYAPHLGTSGGQMLVWGFFISTVALYHGTFTINSLAHRWGTRRYDNADNSRNNFWLALLTLGEGWHNNHHHYPASVRQGFYWWEIDMTYYFLRLMAALGLVWDLKPVPVKSRESNLIKTSGKRRSR